MSRLGFGGKVTLPLPLRIILEQSLEWNSSVYTTLVDSEKAFNSVKRGLLWKLLHHYSIPEKYITLTQKTYDNCMQFFLIEMLTRDSQGCLLSPFLFLLVIDWIMWQTTEKRCDGLQWTIITRLEDLDFADDLTMSLCSHTITRTCKPS